MIPHIVLATLCLNEMEWLPRLYEQHKRWPGMCRWVFVEAATKLYSEVNPELVSQHFLSVDGTSNFLGELRRQDSRITYIPHGMSSHPNPAHDKVQASQRYLDIAESEKPDFIFVLDADEFYSLYAQQRITETLATNMTYNSFMFRQREIWRPPSIEKTQLFTKEVIGGLWGKRHIRGWKWQSGMRYVDSHCWPSLNNTLLIEPAGKFDRTMPNVYNAHLGFAANPQMRLAKHRFYLARKDQERHKHGNLVLDAREAWNSWKSDDRLPGGARVVRYDGVVPEVFREGRNLHGDPR